MRKSVVRIVVFPRYTSLVGVTPVYATPIDVREFGQAIFVAWMGTGFGTVAATVGLVVQGSADLSVWHDIATISPSAGTESVQDWALSLPWLRVKATNSGSDPAVSFWMTVDLVKRDPASGSEAA